MSQQAVAEFFAKVDTDAALQQEVANRAGEDEMPLMKLAAIYAEVAALHGYEFTAEEAAAKMKDALVSSSSDDGELSDEELESVAGGLMCIIVGGRMRCVPI